MHICLYKVGGENGMKRPTFLVILTEASAERSGRICEVGEDVGQRLIVLAVIDKTLCKGKVTFFFAKGLFYA